MHMPITECTKRLNRPAQCECEIEGKASILRITSENAGFSGARSAHRLTIVLNYSSARIVTPKNLTDAELLVLGLVAEMPRHGYELEQLIEQRGMRQWTQIGFSSIYFVLGKLEKMRLVKAKKPAEAKTKKTYAVTDKGRKTLAIETIAALENVRPTYSSVLLGMINWSVLTRNMALEALQARRGAVEAEMARLGKIQIDQQPLPDFVEALFDFSTGQLRAESEWISRTLDYMKCKPWDTQE